MFPTERVVSVRDHRGTEHVVLVQDYAIQEHQGDQGSLEVKAIDSGEGTILIRLPGEVLDESQTITVFEAQLRPVIHQANGSH